MAKFKRWDLLGIKGKSLFRVVDVLEKRLLLFRVGSHQMPEWVETESIREYEICEEETTQEHEVDSVCLKRYTMIASVLAFLGEKKKRAEMIRRAAKENDVSTQTIRNYLFLYLSRGKVCDLFRREREKKPLNIDEKNMRWGLNKFFYTQRRLSLPEAYKMLLRAKYCDETGQLLERYPSFYQFRYFFRKTKSMQTFLISRDGLSNYQRNSRPCLGDGVREFAPAPGTGMIDSTLCDIYLIDENGDSIGRPVFTACIDVFSNMCCGYSVGLENDIDSVKQVFFNMLADKKQWCEKFGIILEADQWPNHELLGKIVTDRGGEYTCPTFDQLTELGVTIVNLPPFRPELKGPIEKLFDIVQSAFKPELKGSGVVQPDFLERGARDYRKEARLTLRDFETVILRCIVYFNSENVIASFPYTEEIIASGVKPYANCFWKYGLNLNGVNLIQVTHQQLFLTLLPRTTGNFDRKGLHLFKTRYKNDNFTEAYLNHVKDVSVAYNPDDLSYVWLVEKGDFIRFELIEKRFNQKSLHEVERVLAAQKEVIQSEKKIQLQKEIELLNHMANIKEAAKIREQRRKG